MKTLKLITPVLFLLFSFKGFAELTHTETLNATGTSKIRNRSEVRSLKKLSKKVDHYKSDCEKVEGSFTQVSIVSGKGISFGSPKNRYFKATSYANTECAVTGTEEMERLKDLRMSRVQRQNRRTRHQRRRGNRHP